MKRMTRILTLVLALCMALTVTAFASGEAYPKFDEYKEYLFETMMQDPFWQGNEANLRAGLDAATSPNDESIQNFTGSGSVDQAPSGVQFPMTYDAWYALNGDTSGVAMSVEEAFVEYIHEWLLAENEINDNMTLEIVEDEFMPLVEAFDFVSFPADMLYNGMLNSGCPMTFEEFAAQYVPAGSASGEAMSAEDAFIEYIHEWLLAELAVNSNMTIEQVEDEFMPLVREMDFVSFPAEMLYSGMLEQGVPMTFEEFAAQYVPAGSASGEAASDEDAFIEYIHEWLLAELAVNSNMTIEQVEDEFMPLIEAGDYTSFPAEMLWSGMLEQGVAMTFDEFVAAGGAG